MRPGDPLEQALSRYLSVPAVATWLTTPTPVRSVPARALQNSFVYAIAFGLDSKTETPLATPARSRMDVEDMLCVCELTPENFALGIVYGLAQPHVFARTPLMARSTPTTRRFAVDLNATSCLEFMELVHFDNAMVCCNYRQFLHIPDGSLPVVVRATLHAPSGSPGVLGPVVMRAEIFEAVTCPACRRDNYACQCPFEAKSRVLSQRVVTRSWTHFTSKFMRKARDGKIRLSLSAVVPAVGEVPVLTRDVDSLNVLVQGQSEYMTLMRRKAVHGLGISVTYPGHDAPLAAPAEAADYLALHNEHARRKRPLLTAGGGDGGAVDSHPPPAAGVDVDSMLRALDESFALVAGRTDAVGSSEASHGTSLLAVHGSVQSGEDGAPFEREDLLDRLLNAVSGRGSRRGAGFDEGVSGSDAPGRAPSLHEGHAVRSGVVGAYAGGEESANSASGELDLLLSTVVTGRRAGGGDDARDSSICATGFMSHGGGGAGGADEEDGRSTSGVVEAAASFSGNGNGNGIHEMDSPDSVAQVHHVDESIAVPWQARAKRVRTAPEVRELTAAVAPAAATSAPPVRRGCVAAEDERKHACDSCPSRFKMRGDLQRHVRVVHEKAKTHVCPTCGKAFGHSGHLNRHQQSHRGERRFKCTLCGFDFHQRSHLLSHLEHIHSSSNGREHECRLCKLRVVSASALRSHLRSVHNVTDVRPPD
jgi:hypothetical protein